jgi:hypothetical protein
MVYYNVMVHIPMCYSNPTIVNMYWYYRKLIYKIIVNGCGYIITYFVSGYWIYIVVTTLSYDNCYANLRDYSNSLLCDLL